MSGLKDVARLLGVRLREISYVPTGANNKRYLLVKELKQSEKKRLLKALSEASDEEIQKAFEDAGIDEKIQKAVTSILETYKSIDEDLPDEVLELLDKACGFGSGDGTDEGDGSGDEGDDDELDQAQEDDEARKQAARKALEKAIEAKRKAAANATKKNLKKGKSQAPGKKSSPKNTASGDNSLSKEAIVKMEMDEEIKELLLKSIEERDNAIEKAQAAEERSDEALKLAKELKEKDLKKQYEGIAKELEYVPLIDIKKHSAIFQKIGEAYPAEFVEILSILKTANKALSKSAAFDELGRSGTPAAAGSAEAEIYKRAEAMVQKDGELTIDEAVERFSIWIMSSMSAMRPEASSGQ